VCLAAVAVVTAACAGSYSEDVRVRVRSSDDVDTTIVLKGTGQLGQSVRAQLGSDKLRSQGWTIVDSQSTSDAWSVTATKAGIPVSGEHTGQLVLQQTDSLLDKTFRLDVPVDPLPVSGVSSGATASVTVQWTVSLPGEVSETNATAQPDKSTVQWTFNTADMQQAHTLHAVSREQLYTSNQIAAAAALTVLVVVGLAFGGILWLRRRARSTTGALPRPVLAIAVGVAVLAVLGGALSFAVASTQPATSTAAQPNFSSATAQATVQAGATRAPVAAAVQPTREVAPAEWEKLQGCRNVGNYFPADAEVSSCYSVRICNTGNVRYGVAYAEYEPFWIPPRWYASGWYGVAPGDCSVVLDSNRWDWGGTAGQSSMAYFAFEYTDAAGRKGSATITPGETNTVLPNKKCVDFNGLTVAFNRCVSKATISLCVNTQDKFDYNFTEKVTAVACDASRGMARIPASIAYHPGLFDQPTMEGDFRNGLERYYGATFRVGFDASDPVTPF
jgi:hypothetical protein